jgi:hypothetical protein
LSHRKSMRHGRCGDALLSLAGLCALASCDSNTVFPVRDAGQDLPTEGGTIQITANTNSCPTVAVTLSPPDANVGDSVVIGARAFDSDVGPDGGASQTLTYAWTAKAGSFEDAKSAQTRYRCETGGPQVLTVAVSDGQCTSVTSATVDCFALPGTVGSGGNAGGKTGSGGSTGSGSGGKASGSGGSGAGGTTGSGGGSGSGSGGASASQCSGDPTVSESELCDQCTTDNCNTQGPGATDGCSLALLGSDAKRQKCLNLYCCIREHDCKKPDGDAVNCWCGDRPSSMVECQTVDSAANGPCLKEFQEAAESMKAADIKKVYVDPHYAIGGAVNLATCRAQFCSKYTGMNGNPQPSPIPCGL